MSPPQSSSARITVLLGRTREDRRRASRTLDALGPFQQSSLLYLTRAQHKVELVRASFWDQPDKPPTFLPEVRTWGSFRDELHQRFGDPRAVLSPIATEMLVGRLWPDLRTTMKRWGALPDTPTMRRELAGLIDNWGHSWPAGQPGASQLTAGHPLLPTDGVAATPSMAPLGHEIRHDLQVLLSTWAQVVQGAQDWTDRAGAGQSLLQILRASEPPAGLVRFLRRFQSVVIDDLLWLSPLDLALLDSLVDAFIRWVPHSQVHLCLEDSGQSALQGGQDTPGRRVTRGLRHMWQARLDAGSAAALEVDSEPHLLDLADHLVHDSRIPRDSPLLDGPVRVRHYGSERTEVRAIARLLRAELLAGRAASDCYVAFPSLDRYLPILRDALHSYGIPFSVRKGHTLRRAPAVSAARLVLRMALDGPQCESLRNLLASGWVRRWYTLESDLAELADTLLHHCRSAGAAVQPDHHKRLVAELQSTLPTPGRVRASMDRLHSLCLRTGARGGEPRKWLGPISAQLLHDQWQRQRRRDPNTTRGQLDPESLKRLARLALDIEAMEAIARP
ncbi:MAG: hypothetical protein CL928_05420, partial [Deltaproteobacteria bacterium]|nr:hypothetical protein [Deltaproteobacteria bacterium]